MYEIPPASAEQLSLQRIGKYSAHLPGTMILVINEQAEIIQCNSLFLKETSYAAADILHSPIRTLTHSERFNYESEANAASNLLHSQLNEPFLLELNKATGD